jgi:hypothetical protein
LRIVIDPEQVVFDRGRKRIRILTQMLLLVSGR